MFTKVTIPEPMQIGVSFKDTAYGVMYSCEKYPNSIFVKVNSDVMISLTDASVERNYNATNLDFVPYPLNSTVLITQSRLK